MSSLVERRCAALWSKHDFATARNGSIDINVGGISQNIGGEESLPQAQVRILAIDLVTAPLHAKYAYGNTQALTEQRLTGNTLGVNFRMTQGGVLKMSEQADGSRAANNAKFQGAA